MANSLQDRQQRDQAFNEEGGQGRSITRCVGPLSGSQVQTQERYAAEDTHIRRYRETGDSGDGAGTGREAWQDCL